MRSLRKRRRPPRRAARPFNVLAVLGTAAHHGFERWAGVGVFLEPWFGRRNTNILWSVSLPLWLWRTLRAQRRDEPWLAFGAGTAIAGVIVHYWEWPWSLRLGFLPWLEEAEGFRPSLLPAYNTILSMWFIGAVGAVVRETRLEDLKYVAAGTLTGPPLLVSARHHFAWAREQAVRGDPHFTSDLLTESPRRPRGAEKQAS
jgi:hypothetical protein